MLTNAEVLRKLRKRVEQFDTYTVDECIHHSEYCEGQSDTVQDVLEAIDEMIEELI